MAGKSIFEATGNGGQDEATLYSLAGEFLEAACLLDATPPTRMNCSSATYYLLAHAAELFLKAFLYHRGMTISDLKGLGHNLQRLIAKARDMRLPTTVVLTNVLQLASAYEDKRFEYRTRTKNIVPAIDLLIREVAHLQATVFSCISRHP